MVHNECLHACTSPRTHAFARLVHEQARRTALRALLQPRRLTAHGLTRAVLRSMPSSHFRSASDSFSRSACAGWQGHDGL